MHPVRAALETPRDEDRDLYAVAHAVTGHDLSAPHERVIYTESHDEVANGRSRVPESVAPGADDSWHARTRAALGLVLTLTSPGIPMLFQGQDFLEDRWFDDQTRSTGPRRTGTPDSCTSRASWSRCAATPRGSPADCPDGIQG